MQAKTNLTPENNTTSLNREQKRKAKRRLKSTGFTIDQALEYLSARNRYETSVSLPENTLVKLNYAKIISTVGYEKRQNRYKEFVEAHKDDVMTVMYDERHQSGKMVLLKEDENDPKFLWWSGDLTVVDLQEGEQS